MLEDKVRPQNPLAVAPTIHLLMESETYEHMTAWLTESLRLYCRCWYIASLSHFFGSYVTEWKKNNLEGADISQNICETRNSSEIWTGFAAYINILKR